MPTSVLSPWQNPVDGDGGAMIPGGATFGRWGMATRVTAAAVLLLGLLLAVDLLIDQQTTQAARRAQIGHAADTGDAVAGMIDEFARNLETSLLSLSYGVARQTINQDNTGPALAGLSREVGLQPDLFVFVTDPAGRVVASASGASIGVDLSSRPYLQALMGGVHEVWGPAVSGLQTSAVTLTYGREVRAIDGTLRGYVVTAFYPASLAARFRPRIPDDAGVTIVDGRGFTLYSTQYPELTDQRDLSTRPEIQAALRGETARIESAPDLFGPERRFGVVAPVPGTGWAVAFTRPLAPLEAQLRDQLLLQTAMIAAAALAVAILLTLTTRHVIHPLRRLAETAGAVARGERAPTAVVGGGREVRELAEAIEVMARAVGSREESLQRDLARRRVLAETSAAFAAAGTDLQEELQTVARLVSQYVGEGCNLFLLSMDHTWLEPAVIYHPAPDIQLLVADWLTSAPVPIGEELAGRAASTGVPVVLTDVFEEAEPLVSHARYEHFRVIGMRAYAAVRIAARGRTIGVLAAWRTTPTPYTAEEVSLLDEIAALAGINIENAQLIEEVRQHAATAERAGHIQEEFTTRVAHDLLNPLASIKAVAQLTLRQLDRTGSTDPVQLQTDMRTLELYATKAANEVGRAIELARTHAQQTPELSLAPTDLVEIVEEAVEGARRTSTRHHIISETSHTFVIGEWDRERLLQVVDNLLNNAIKYSPHGGAVRVVLRTESRDSKDWGILEVHDEGIGIPPLALPHIFDRFYRAENAARFVGTGVGLSSVRQIVEAHGGTIDVRSEEDRGSVFTVCLPSKSLELIEEDSAVGDHPSEPAAVLGD